MGHDWRATVTTGLTDLAEAWREPAAWHGTASLGGPTELPAAMIGGMVCVELAVHGWDLARATAQEPRWDDDVTMFTLRQVTDMAPQGREHGVFGSEVDVPDSASALDKALGRSGRDPSWRPATSPLRG